MERYLVVIVVAACSKAAPMDLSTPDAAARCLLAGLDAQSWEAVKPCIHPTLRDLPMPENKPDWAKLEKIAAPLRSAKASDFTLEPITDKMLGDQRATFRLDNGNGNHDDFEVVRLDGRWYIIDTGI